MLAWNRPDLPTAAALAESLVVVSRRGASLTVWAFPSSLKRHSGAGLSPMWTGLAHPHEPRERRRRDAQLARRASKTAGTDHRHQDTEEMRSVQLFPLA